MSCGCIPILTRIDSFKKMTNNESCGLLFEVGNSASLVTAFQKAINMNITLEKQKTLAIYKEQLSPDAIAKNMMAAFEQ
jgi:glycosyltransferase involved in cell wall biosynthesis